MAGVLHTGEWVGDMLKVNTTHIKEGWLRRNGLARSDKADMTEFYIRHGDYFTLATIVHDPVYMTAPLIRTSNWILDPGYHPIASTCVPAVEMDHPKGWVAYPAYPDRIPYLKDTGRRIWHSGRRSFAVEVYEPSIRKKFQPCRFRSPRKRRRLLSMPGVRLANR